MSQMPNGKIIPIGLAMFSMFFGSGNIIFPVLVGQVSQDKVLYAILGLLLTAVIVPLVGLISMALFDGNYLKFFSEIRFYSWLGCCYLYNVISRSFCYYTKMYNYFFHIYATSFS